MASSGPRGNNVEQSMAMDEALAFKVDMVTVEVADDAAVAWEARLLGRSGGCDCDDLGG